MDKVKAAKDAMMRRFVAWWIRSEIRHARSGVRRYDLLSGKSYVSKPK